jgi:hypothetical protein
VTAAISELSGDNVLPHLPVERTVSQQLPQLGFLILQLRQLRHLGRSRPLMLLLPNDMCRLGDSRPDPIPALTPSRISHAALMDIRCRISFAGGGCRGGRSDCDPCSGSRDRLGIRPLSDEGQTDA